MHFWLWLVGMRIKLFRQSAPKEVSVSYLRTQWAQTCSVQVSLPFTQPASISAIKYFQQNSSLAGVKSTVLPTIKHASTSHSTLHLTALLAFSRRSQALRNVLWALMGLNYLGLYLSTNDYPMALEHIPWLWNQLLSVPQDRFTGMLNGFGEESYITP